MEAIPQDEEAVSSALGSISNFGFTFQNINLIPDPAPADIQNNSL